MNDFSLIAIWCPGLVVNGQKMDDLRYGVAWGVFRKMLQVLGIDHVFKMIDLTVPANDKVK